jgi:hypothetical protein
MEIQPEVTRHKIDNEPVNSSAGAEVRRTPPRKPKLRLSNREAQEKLMNDIERLISLLRRAIATSVKDSILYRMCAAILLLLIASTEQTADVMRLVELTDLPEEFVVRVADGMRAHGLLKEAGIDTSRWLDDAGRMDIRLITEALTCLGETTLAAECRGMDRRRG